MKKKRQLTNSSQNSKFKKVQKGHLQPIERKKTTTNLYYGVYGLKVLQSNRLQSSQLEAAQRQIVRNLRKHEFLWVRVTPDISVTKKPNEIRMGKGKGAVDHWVARVKAGQTIFELTSMWPTKAHYLFLAAAKKLAVPCVIISHHKKLIKSSRILT